MANAQLTKSFQRKILDALHGGTPITASTPYLRCFTAMSNDGDTFTEVTNSGGYGPEELTFGSAASNRSIALTAASYIVGTGTWSSGSNIVAAGIGNSGTYGEGDLMLWWPLATPLAIGAGEAFGYDAAGLTVSLAGAISIAYGNAVLDTLLRNTAWTAVTQVDVALMKAWTDDETWTELAGAGADAGYERAEDVAFDAATDAAPAASLNTSAVGLGTATGDWTETVRRACLDQLGAVIMSVAATYAVTSGKTARYEAGELSDTLN